MQSFFETPKKKIFLKNKYTGNTKIEYITDDIPTTNSPKHVIQVKKERLIKDNMLMRRIMDKIPVLKDSIETTLTESEYMHTQEKKLDEFYNYVFTGARHNKLDDDDIFRIKKMAEITSTSIIKKTPIVILATNQIYSTILSNAAAMQTYFYSHTKDFIKDGPEELLFDISIYVRHMHDIRFSFNGRLICKPDKKLEYIRTLRPNNRSYIDQTSLGLHK